MYRSALLAAGSLVFALCLGCGGSSSKPSGGAAGASPSTGGAGSGAGGAGSSGASGASGSIGAAGSAGSSPIDAGDVSDAGDADAASAKPDGATSDGAAAFCSPGTSGNGSFTLTSTADPPEWTLAPPAKAGTLTASATFMSPSYGLSFAYQIYTSASYVAGKPAIFLLFGDGITTYLSNDTNNGGFHAKTVLDNLTSAGDLPPTVALFIDPPTDGKPADSTDLRVATYDPPTDKYATFLMNEIIPATITGKYSVSSDPDAWAIIGYSASGGQGFNVVWKRPNAFHKFIGSNASYGAANVAMYGNVDWAQIIASTTPPHDLRVSNVTCQNDLSDTRGSWLTIITNLHNTLVTKGYAARLETGPNGHFPPIDGEHDFPSSLRWMFQGCKFASQ
jgi:enterochelin esterase family protein